MKHVPARIPAIAVATTVALTAVPAIGAGVENAWAEVAASSPAAQAARAANSVTVGDFVLTGADAQPVEGVDYRFESNTLYIGHVGSTTDEFKKFTVSMKQGVSSTTTCSLVAKGNVELTLSDVSIDQSGAQLPGLKVQDGTGKVTLVGSNFLKGGVWNGRGQAGLQVEPTGVLEIDGGGSLEATGGFTSGTDGKGGAGIGGSSDAEGKNITINGGTIVANGKNGGAGIGGGSNASGKNITINGGTVTAQSTGNGGGPSYSNGVGAGIGAGKERDGSPSFPTGENITITGGTVNAIGGHTGAGIGGAGAFSSARNITITGGTIKASATGKAAAIGGGGQGGGNNITITGGDLDVSVKDIGGGSAIGGGHPGKGSASESVEITGGRFKFNSVGKIAPANGLKGGKFACKDENNFSCIGYRQVYRSNVADGYGVAANVEADKEEYGFIIKPRGTVTCPQFEHGDSMQLTYGDQLLSLIEGAEAIQPDQSSPMVELWYRDPGKQSSYWGENWKKVEENTVLDVASGGVYEFRALVEQQNNDDNTESVYAPTWIDCKVTFKPKTLTADMFSDIESVIYDAEGQEPVVSPSEDEPFLTTDDFTVEYRNNVNAGTATAVISGKRNYATPTTGSGEDGDPVVSVPVEVPFTIAKAPLTLAANDVSVAFGDEPAYTYSGMGFKGSDNESVLKEVQIGAVDYRPGETAAGQELPITVSAKADNYDITPQQGMLTVVEGRAEFESIGTYNDSGAESTEFTFGDVITVKAKLALANDGQADEGQQASAALAVEEATPGTMTLYYNSTPISDPVQMADDGTCELEYDTSKRIVPVGEEDRITVHYASNGSVADVESETNSFRLSARTLDAGMFSIADVTYNGAGQTPAVAKAENADPLLDIAKDCIIEADGYQNNLHAADKGAEVHPFVTVKSQEGGFYTGEVEVPFTINPAEATVMLEDATIAVGADLPMLQYDVEGLFNGDKLAKGTTSPITVTCAYDKETSGVGAIPIVARVEHPDEVNPDYTVKEPIEDGTLTVVQSQSAIEAKAYDEDGSPRSEFTYGDTIVIKATANATGEVAAGEEPSLPGARAADDDGESLTMTICNAEGEALCSSTEVRRGVESTFSFDTQDVKQMLSPGKNTLKVVLAGDDDMAEAEQSLVITVNPQVVSDVALTGDASKVYDGTTDVLDGGTLALSFGGALQGDEVSLGGTFSFSDKNAGTKTVNVADLAFSGADAQWYQLPDGMTAVSGEVQGGIAKRPVTVTADDAEVAAGGDLPELGYTIQGAMGDEGLLEGESLGESIVCAVEDAYSKDTAKAGQTFEIAPSGAANSNYSIKYMTGTLTVVLPDGPITLPGDDGQLGTEDDVEVIVPDDSQAASDGGIDLPGGGEVTLPGGDGQIGGGDDAKVTLPGGSHIGPDGSVSVPESGQISLPGENGQLGDVDDVTVIPGEGGATVGPDGSVTLPGGGTVDGPHSGGALVSGGTVVHPDGSADIPAGGRIDLPGQDGQLGGNDDVAVLLPEGEASRLNPDGSVTLSGGGTVVRPDGTFEVPAGSKVLPDGTIIYPGQGEAIPLPSDDDGSTALAPTGDAAGAVAGAAALGAAGGLAVMFASLRRKFSRK
ncbi:hypothetical protein B5F40_09485 [Gordonibacter sp. An230]|uniref:MBG domain-containing protein n=1 Tax=Gordonibacter sp. An230 TaxID=1965592 RepID=UPI000B3AF797|nr:MBG domain-containing protein [Gordonibacter sp. An230]OUO89751.1 hypothetical protein B5F40_09485 [Gordonibacter sp. An230]